MINHDKKIIQEGEGYVLYSPIGKAGLRILEAKEGFKIFSSDNSKHLDKVYLSPYDSIDNYGVVYINEKGQSVETSEITKIKNNQNETNEMLDILFTAADEMFSMVDAMMGSVMMLNESSGLTPMGRFYAAMVERDLKSIDDIPIKYRKEVEDYLN